MVAILASMENAPTKKTIWDCCSAESRPWEPNGSAEFSWDVVNWLARSEQVPNAIRDMPNGTAQARTHGPNQFSIQPMEDLSLSISIEHLAEYRELFFLVGEDLDGE